MLLQVVCIYPSLPGWPQVSSPCQARYQAGLHSYLLLSYLFPLHIPGGFQQIPGNENRQTAWTLARITETLNSTLVSEVRSAISKNKLLLMHGDRLFKPDFSLDAPLMKLNSR